jgi:hypothetical protein
MALSFQPRTEEEIATAGLAPAGEYDFEVLQAEDAISKKNGNPMIKLKIGLYNGDRIRQHVYDYLLTSFESKLRHFCDTAGLLRLYENGSLSAEDCLGRTGRVRIEQEPASGSYPAKNVVDDYVVRKAKPLAPPAAAGTRPATGEDDVPF